MTLQSFKSNWYTSDSVNSKKKNVYIRDTSCSTGPLRNVSMQMPGNITKTSLFKYIENFISKNWKISDKKTSDIFFIFLLKT